MKTKREQFEAYYNLPGAKHPDEEEIVLAAADAYDSAISRGRITSEEVNVIVDAVSSKRTRIWMNCYGIMASATEKWRNAAEAIIDMSHNSKAHVRFNAICCLSRQTPQDVIDTVLKSGLIDRSSRVRWKAADKANTLGKVHLIPHLEAALSAEKDENAFESIQLDLGFLRDGYFLEPRSDGSYWVSVRLKNGGTGATISEDELRAKGISRIVSDIRKKCGEY